MLTPEAKIISRAFLKQAFAAVPALQQHPLAAKIEEKRPWYSAVKDKFDTLVKRVRSSDPKAMAALLAYKSINPVREYAKLDKAIGGPIAAITGQHSTVGDINDKYKGLGKGSKSMKDWFKKKFGRNPEEDGDAVKNLLGASAPGAGSSLTPAEVEALKSVGGMTGQVYLPTK